MEIADSWTESVQRRSSCPSTHPSLSVGWDVYSSVYWVFPSWPGNTRWVGLVRDWLSFFFSFFLFNIFFPVRLLGETYSKWLTIMTSYNITEQWFSSSTQQWQLGGIGIWSRNLLIKLKTKILSKDNLNNNNSSVWFHTKYSWP